MLEFINNVWVGLSFITLVLGIIFLFKQPFLKISGIWIINSSLFAIVEGLDIEGVYIALFFIPLGLYIIFKYLESQRIDRLGWILIGICILEMLTTYFLAFYTGKNAFYNNFVFYKVNIFLLIFIPVLSQNAKLIKRSRKQIMSYYSEINFEYYNWLKNLLFIISFGILLGGITILIEFWIQPLPVYYTIAFGVLTLSSSYLFYAAYFKFDERFFTDGFKEYNQAVQVEELDIAPPTPSKEQEYTMKELTNIKKQIEDDKIYTRPDLTLSDLGEFLGMGSKRLSNILNKGFDKNFYDFINEMRIEDVKQKLLDDEFNHYTLLSIGLEAGFNSKTTFYATFKKFVGCTPNQFRKQFKGDQEIKRSIISNQN